MITFGKLVFARLSFVWQLIGSILLALVLLQSLHLIVETIVQVNLIYVLACTLALPMLFIIKMTAHKIRINMNYFQTFKRTFVCEYALVLFY